MGLSLNSCTPAPVRTAVNGAWGNTGGEAITIGGGAGGYESLAIFGGGGSTSIGGAPIATTAATTANPHAGHAMNTAPVLATNRTVQTGESATEQRVTELVNKIRAKYGLGALTFQSALDAAAEGHNLTMIRARTMAHDGIGDGSPGDRVRATGYRGAWGENVAVGQTSAEQVVAEWMASPTHRANILNPSFSRLSVAHGATTDGLNFWAQSFGG